MRGFLGSNENDAPPARLAFYSAPAAGVPEPRARAPPLADLLHPRRQPARGADRLAARLQHCQTLDEALNRRASLQPGEVIYVPTGHAVSRPQRELAQSSEQSGLLAPLRGLTPRKELRAQALNSNDRAHRAGCRAEAAYANASQRLVAARREATEDQAAPTNCRWKPCA